MYGVIPYPEKLCFTVQECDKTVKSHRQMEELMIIMPFFIYLHVFHIFTMYVIYKYISKLICVEVQIECLSIFKCSM